MPTWPRLTDIGAAPLAADLLVRKRRDTACGSTRRQNTPALPRPSASRLSSAFSNQISGRFAQPRCIHISSSMLPGPKLPNGGLVQGRELPVGDAVRHPIGALPAPHRRFWSAVVTHRRQIDGRLRRIVSHELVKQPPLADVSAVMSAAPGEGIAGDRRNSRRRKQGGGHNSRRSGHHLKPTYWLAHIGDFGPP